MWESENGFEFLDAKFTQNEFLKNECLKKVEVGQDVFHNLRQRSYLGVEYPITRQVIYR